MMQDWKVTNYVEPTLSTGQTWVYYENSHFPNIHFSRSVSDNQRDHIAANDRQYYYYGVTETFNTNPPANIKDNLEAAWKDYFKVS